MRIMSMTAFEEIGLPMNFDTVRLLTILEPVLSPNDLLVTPVVVFLTDSYSYNVCALSYAQCWKPI